MSSSSERIPGLDVLRCCAILFVICHHYQSSSGGFIWNNIFEPFFYVLWTGVDLFFVLSGFLIATQWFVSIEKDSLSWAYKQFYIKRAFRILPSYWVVLGLYSLQAILLTKHEFNILHYLLFIQNFSEISIFGVSWSLCVEEHFYLFFPSIALFLWRARNVWLVVIACSVVLFLTIYLRHYFWLEHVKQLYTSIPLNEHDPYTFDSYYKYIYFPTTTRLDGLSLGIIIAAIKYYLPQAWENIIKYGTVCLIGGVLGLIGSFLLVYNKYQWASVVFGFLVVSFSYSLLIISALSRHPVFTKLHSPIITQIALLSYAMYLVFPGILTLMDAITKTLLFNIPDPFYFSLLLLIIIIASYGLYFLIEKPSLIARKWVLKKLAPH